MHIELYSQDSGYLAWFSKLKASIRNAQANAAKTLNTQLLETYWNLGRAIVEKQSQTKWGSKFIDQLSIDLMSEFPQMKGFSRRNLYAMKQWYVFYAEHYQEIPTEVAQIPWGHNRLIMARVNKVEEALFYARETIKQGWSRDTLDIQLDNKLVERQGGAISNFSSTLPLAQSKVVAQTLKDPYIFDFLSLHDQAQEREIELALTANITEFLLELGKGFAFVGRQYKMEISDTDYFIDLLFYHLELRCYVVIELKAGKFKPEYAGKLNFYLSAVDSQLKHPSDQPTIGILLCRKKDRIEAEYALRDINKPMGISNFDFNQAIPDNIKTKLPTIEQLEEGLSERINQSHSAE